jgi:hypothetical protein
MKSALKLLAQASPGLEKYLLAELKLYGLKPVKSNFLGVNGLEMNSSQEKLFDILHKW